MSSICVFAHYDVTICSQGDNVIRRVSDGAVMAGGQIILSEGIAPVGGGWSVFTVGELCAQRRAFVFKIGGRCDKVAVGFCVFGSGSGQEDVVIKRLQVNKQLDAFVLFVVTKEHATHMMSLILCNCCSYCTGCTVHNSPRVSYCRTMLIFALQSGGWQQPEFFGVLGGRSGVICGHALLPVHSLRGNSMLCRCHCRIAARCKAAVAQPAFHQSSVQHLRCGIES